MRPFEFWRITPSWGRSRLSRELCERWDWRNQKGRLKDLACRTLLLAAGVEALGVRLRQPLIVAFIAVGILAGHSLLSWVSANDRVDLLAKLGITLLLFVVGLHAMGEIRNGCVRATPWAIRCVMEMPKIPNSSRRCRWPAPGGS